MKCTVVVEPSVSTPEEMLLPYEPLLENIPAQVDSSVKTESEKEASSKLSSMCSVYVLDVLAFADTVEAIIPNNSVTKCIEAKYEDACFCLEGDEKTLNTFDTPDNSFCSLNTYEDENHWNARGRAKTRVKSKEQPTVTESKKSRWNRKVDIPQKWKNSVKGALGNMRPKRK